MARSVRTLAITASPSIAEGQRDAALRSLVASVLVPTLEDLIERSCGSTTSQSIVRRLSEFERWPPDTFAIVAAFLQATGSYRLAVAPPLGEHWPPFPTWPDQNYVDAMAYASAVETWLESDETSAWDGPTPLRFMMARLGEKAEHLAKDWSFVSNCLCALALADQASMGIGLPGGTLRPHTDYKAMLRLSQCGSCSSLPPSRIRVLPKLRTPQSGISLRSLSANLAFVTGEVNVEWNHVTTKLSIPRPEEPKTLDILVIPWPLCIEPADFRISNETYCLLDHSEFGFFDFEPSWVVNPNDVVRLIDRARALGGGPQLVVFPELALDRPTLERIKHAIGRRYGDAPPVILAGIRGRDEDERPVNQAVLSYLEPGSRAWNDYTQDKHHRWFLDAGQIRTYQLGAQLHPDKKWWEAIDVPPRNIQFFALADSVVFCTLICEDLARFEPVSPVVRAVGPTLLFALLLDGPQVKGRWGSRYAASLAEDPGTSVLTVSSLGMVERSETPPFPPSRAVALWKDQIHGEQSIELSSGHVAALLTVAVRSQCEWIADGRDDRNRAAVLSLESWRGLA